jgi:hypothetical protein
MAARAECAAILRDAAISAFTRVCDALWAAPQDEDRNYFFWADGHGAPQGAQAPAKSSGETAGADDGLER